MVIIYVLIGVAMLLMLDTFSNIQQFDLIDATLLYYKNVSRSAPARPHGSLTYSIQKQLSQLQNYKNLNSPLDLYNLPFNESLVAKEFHQKYLKRNLNKLSKTFTIVQDAPTTKIISVNNEWQNFIPYSTIDLFVIDEEQLYGINRKSPMERAWRSCLYNQINGSLEAIAYNDEKGILAGIYNAEEEMDKVFRIYHGFDCQYKDSVDNMDLFREHCYENKSYQSRYICQACNITIKSDPNVTEVLNEKDEDIKQDKKTPVFEDISLGYTPKVMNLAVTENMIAYTTIADKLRIHYVYKGTSEEWFTRTVDYPRTFRRFKFKQNIGLIFVGDSKDGEKQLLAVDLIGNDHEMYLIYFVHKFIDGNSLINNSKLRTEYFFNETNNIDPHKVYSSIMYDLFKFNISAEFNQIDITNSHSIPRSIVKYNPKTRQILSVSLNRYVHLICIKDEVFAAYQIHDFEDQMYRIKNFAISPSGLFFIFLAQHKNKMKIFLLNNEYIRDTNLNKLYLLNFDYSINPDEKTVLDLKLTKNIDNQMSLMLLLEHGEMAVYALHFGAGKYKGGILEMFIEDELDFLSFGLLIVAIIMLVMVRYARSIRININIRRQE